jgi:acetyl esterase/lipase
MAIRRVLSLFVGTVGLVVATTQPLAARQRIFPVADKPVVADHYPDRVTHFPQGVTGLADVVYSVVPSYRPMILDLYLPPKASAPKPLVVYIHGGGWIGGHTRHNSALADYPKVLASLAAEGFVVASIEYRLSGEARFPAQLQDVRAALRFLKDNAPKYGIDPSRVGLWGGSAGGHLTGLTAVTCGDHSLEAPLEKGKPAPAAGSECVQAAVTWYGVLDMAPTAARPGGDGAIGKLLGCTGACDLATITPANPISNIGPKTPTFLLIHGEDDHTVPVAQSHHFEAALKAAGVPVQAIYIPGVDHSFIGKTPAETRAAVLKATNATFDFFHQQLDRTNK